jgi:hypothetical protein
MKNIRNSSRENGNDANKDSDELTAKANRRKASGSGYFGGGNIGYDLIVAIIAFPVWFIRALAIKSKSGKPLIDILREHSELYEDSLGIAVMLLLLVFAVFIYINNR